MKNGEGFPFHIILDDPSGNSFIRNPFAPNSDPEMRIEKYIRTKEQAKAMGYDFQNEIPTVIEETKESEKLTSHRVLDFTKPLDEDLSGESFSFTTTCHNCGKAGENKMCKITIPYFKELIIMSFSCENCGATSREIKTGG